MTSASKKKSLLTLTAFSDPSSLKSSYFITSAIMKPFSKSVWIFPAAWGAFVPFFGKDQRKGIAFKMTGYKYRVSFLWSAVAQLKLQCDASEGVSSSVGTAAQTEHRHSSRCHRDTAHSFVFLTVIYAFIDLDSLVWVSFRFSIPHSGKKKRFLSSFQVEL